MYKLKFRFKLICATFLKNRTRYYLHKNIINKSFSSGEITGPDNLKHLVGCARVLYKKNIATIINKNYFTIQKIWSKTTQKTIFS